jgi:hypothetical protein
MSTEEKREHKPFTAASLAREANTDPSYVARLCREGKIPASKLGYVWFISHDDGMEWIKNREENESE